MLTHPSGLFQDAKFRPLGGAGLLVPQIFTLARFSPEFSNARPKLGWGPPENFNCEH